MEDKNVSVAKFRLGEKVRDKRDHKIMFTINECRRGRIKMVNGKWHDANGDNGEIYYEGDGCSFPECYLELCPKMVKKKIGFWINVYLSADGNIHTGGVTYDTEEKAKHEAVIFNYLGARYFECETEVEE